MNKKKFEILLITVLCTLIVVFTVLNITKKPAKKPLPIDTPPIDKVIPFYELKDEFWGDKMFKVLYINGIYTNRAIYNPGEENRVFKIDDIVVLSDVGVISFYNKDAQEIEDVKITKDVNDENFYYNVTKVVDRDIYITTTYYGTVCDYLNKVYLREWKITYLGNQEFSSPELVSTKKGNDYIKENQYICSFKEINKKNIRPIKKIEELVLTDYQEHKVLLNNKEVTIKQINDQFHYQTYEINGELFHTESYTGNDAYSVYVTDQYILLMYVDSSLGFRISYYVDENGNVKEYISDEYVIAYNTFKLKNNKLNVSLYTDNCASVRDNQECKPDKKAVLYYDGINMILA